MVEQNRSLGAFKPCDVDFSWQKAPVEDQAKREACYDQLSFFDRRKKAIERVPFDFYYHFRCAGKCDCPAHKLKIVDWEMGEAYRKWRDESDSEGELFQKIRQEWLTEICSDENDVYFYVGNMQRLRDQFLVLGVFYPKK
jgi:hypothetical protein